MSSGHILINYDSKLFSGQCYILYRTTSWLFASLTGVFTHIVKSTFNFSK